jgi:two-component system sensor histidine kinase HydH
MSQVIIAGLVGLAAGLAAALFFFKKNECKKTAEKENPAVLRQENSQLVGQLAHEIKNPLSTIKINLKLIAEDLQALRDRNIRPSSGTEQPDEPNLASTLRKINIIKKEADRLEQTLDNFLRFTDSIQPQLSKVDINNLVSDMIDFYTPQAISHSIVTRQILYPKPLICRIDANLLKQALLNLFINAQHAMENGGELLIRTERSNSFAVIVVSDTGVGIEPEGLSKVFEGFSIRPGGRGLGLPIVKKIIDMHNGTIAVESLSGKGTSFTIKLPLSKQ